MLCFTISSYAQTIWTGAGTNTNWSNTDNWNNNLLPSTSDDVTIPTGKTVTINVGASVKSIAVQGNSTVNINANLNFLNASSFATGVIVNWTTGSLYGGATLTNNGNVNLTTNGSRYISGATTIINNGVFTMPAGGYLYLYDTSIFNNTTSGTFDIQSAAVLSYSGSTHQFLNAGLFKKTTSVGNSIIQCLLTNTGTINVESGTLTMGSLEKTFDGGNYNVVTGSELILSTQINASNTLMGVLDGAMTWANNVSVTATATFNFTGATGVNWNSSSLIGGGILTNASTINLASNSSRYISGNTTLKNTGLVTMPSAGYLFLYDTSVFNNTSTGIFDIQSDAVISNSGSAAHNFNNAGLLKKTISSGTAQIQSNLSNTGTISVVSGNLTMNNLAKNFDGGMYNVNAGSQLNLASVINVSNILTGVLDGAMTWTNDISVASTATFNFTGTTGVNWNAGSLIGGGILTNASTINLASNNSRYISGNTTLKNTGLVNMPAGGYLYLYDTSVFNNTASGTFDLQSAAVLSYSGSGAHQFLNAGLLKKTTTVGNSLIQCLLTNTGTINVENGTLTMGSLAKNFDGGTYNVAAGSQLILNGPINVSNILTGLLDGAMTWADNVSVATTATFNFTGATGVNWISGRLLGGGILTNASTINFANNGSRYISGTVTTLANTGLITMPNGGYLYLYDDTVLDNKATGVVDFQSDFVVSYSGSGVFKIINAGLIKKSAGTSSTSIFVPVTNSGTIDASSGKLNIVDGRVFINTIDGIIKGSATIDLPAAAEFTNDGTFAPGNSPGILSVLGTYKSSASSKLSVELNGLTQGTEYDLLAITGTNAIFEGNVEIAMGFDAAVGNQFTIATTSAAIITANLTSPIGNVDYNGYRYTFDVTYPLNNKVVLTISNKLDIQKPTAVAQNITVPLNAAGTASITPSQINNGSTDNHTIPANLLYSLNTSNFTCANLGANTVTLTVTDEAGNFETATATVTVVDLLAPSISCPSDFTVTSSGNYTLPDYFANSTIAAADNCAIVTQTQNPVAGTSLAHGDHTISFLVSDVSGNTNTCFFKLTVQDTTLSTTNIEFSENNIIFYPNPVVDILTIKNTSNVKLLSLEIIDASGKMLDRMDLSKMEKTKNISLENYPSGMYLIKVNSANATIIKKILKK